MKKVLIIGRGGREHALAWKFAQSPQISVIVAPGNPGMKDVATTVDIDESNFDALIDFAKTNDIDLTFVGPELPLTEGIVDKFTAAGLTIFGPTAVAAAIEGSKAFAKNLMNDNNIPTAEYKVFDNYQTALTHIETAPMPIVIKADGLASGKGVTIAATKEEAQKALEETMNGRFGDAGTTVVIEEFLQGEEFSYLAFVHGENVYPMEISRDHKPAYDNDKGPNTGGMGAYCPAHQIPQKVIDTATVEILQKTAKAMVKNGTPFTGILYAGLIATSDGPKVIEFNARFGDPETEVVLPRLTNDLYRVIIDVLAGKDPMLEWSSEPVLGVVLCSKGYPDKYNIGIPITGLDELEKDTLVFHCGTAVSDGLPVTNGGRVLLIARKAPTLQQARQKVYDEVAKIQWDGIHYRKDIGSAISVK